MPNWMTDRQEANLTKDEVGYVQGVFDTLQDWQGFMANWELTKAFHLRVVLPVEERERLRDWDKFLSRFRD